jgi:hypothetical protein
MDFRRGLVLRARFLLESAIACVTAAVALLTLVRHEWIERLFSVDPDGGSGALEWAVVLLLFFIAVVSGASARLEWRRATRAV